MPNARPLTLLTLVALAMPGAATVAGDDAKPAPSRIREIYLATFENIFCLSADLHLDATIELGGPCTHVGLIPGNRRIAAALAAMDAAGARVVSKVLSIDPTSRKVEAIATIDEVPISKEGTQRWVVGDAALDQAGIVRRDFGPLNAEVRTKVVCSLEWLDFSTHASRTLPLEDDVWDIRIHRVAGGGLRATSYTVSCELWTLDIGGRSLWKVTSEPFADSGFPTRGFEIDSRRGVAELFGRNGERREIPLAGGAVQASTLPIEDVGTQRFVESVRRSEASRTWALGILGEEAEHNAISSVRFFDETWKERGRVSGIPLWDFAFSPDGAEIVILATDGTISRHSVPDGKLLASQKHSPPLSFIIVGIR